MDTEGLPIRFPVATSQKQTVPSELPDATAWPSRLIATRSGIGCTVGSNLLMGGLNVRTCLPSVALHTPTVPAASAAASSAPDSLMAASMGALGCGTTSGGRPDS